MKKVTKMAAALAAVMMVMALAACSHDGGSSLASLSAAGSSGTGTGSGTGSGSGTGTGSTSSALTGTWTALDYKPSDGPTSADSSGRAIDAGTTLGAVTVKGSGAQWKPNNSSNPESWSYLETGKKDGGCLEFTIAASSTIEVVARSGNASGSDIVLCKNIDGTNSVSEASGKATVSNSNETLTYNNVPAGTYYLGAYPADSLSRGVRIVSITVK